MYIYICTTACRLSYSRPERAKGVPRRLRGGSRRAEGLYIYIYIYICVCMYMYICICIYTCISIYLSLSLYIYI